MITSASKSVDTTTFRQATPRSLLKRVSSPSIAANKVTVDPQEALSASLSTFKSGASALRASMQAAIDGDYDRAIALLKD